MRTTTIGVAPARQVKYEPGSSSCVSEPAYCHVRPKIRSCSRRSTSGSEYHDAGSVSPRSSCSRSAGVVSTATAPLYAAHGLRTTLPRVDTRPIGVFDSGAGGLTVLHECLVTLPHEDFVYLGDGARLPYGPRPLEEIRRFAGEIARFLEGQGVKLVVAACNSATAAALPDLQRALTSRSSA